MHRVRSEFSVEETACVGFLIWAPGDLSGLEDPTLLSAPSLLLGMEEQRVCRY